MRMGVKLPIYTSGNNTTAREMLCCSPAPSSPGSKISSSSFTSRASIARTDYLASRGLESIASHRFDFVAIWLSGACLIHCIAIPFAVFAIPVMGDHLLGSETIVHWLLLAPAVPVSIVSLWFGYRRHSYLAGIVIGAGGLSLMFIGVSHLADRSYEIPLTVLGVSLVGIAHVLNMRRIRNHKFEDPVAGA